MNLLKLPRLPGKTMFWSAILVSGLLGWKCGDDLTIRVSDIAPSHFKFWSLSLMTGQLLTAMAAFLLLYWGIGLGLVVKIAAKRGITIHAESVFVGTLLAAFLPLLFWAVGVTLMMDLARSGMHDSM